MVILEFVLNELNAKIPNNVIFSNRKETKTWEKGEMDSELQILFLVRESLPSL